MISIVYYKYIFLVILYRQDEEKSNQNIEEDNASE